MLHRPYQLPYRAAFSSPLNSPYPVSGGGAAALTWDSSYKNADIDLTGGDLVATVDAPGIADYIGVRGTLSAASGLKSVAFLFDDGYGDNGNDIRVGLTTGALDIRVAGACETALIVVRNEGATNIPAGQFDVPNATVVQIDYKAATGQVWVKVGASYPGGGDPAAGTGEDYTITPGTTVYPFCALVGDPTHPTSVTLSEPDFPTGFSAYGA